MDPARALLSYRRHAFARISVWKKYASSNSSWSIISANNRTFEIRDFYSTVGDPEHVEGELYDPAKSLRCRR